MTGHFPSITGKNLNKERITVPDDFLDKHLILLLGYQRWHQPIIDDSIHSLEASGMEQTHHIIEIPVIKPSSWLAQMRLDGLMRAAIRDTAVRQRTITVYLDKQKFRDQLNLPNEDTSHWFLVKQGSNEILLRGKGRISVGDIEQLRIASN